MNKYACLIVVISLVSSIKTKGQAVSRKLFVTTSYVPAANFSDTTGNYASNSLSMGFSVPIAGKVLSQEGDSPSFYMVLINGEIEVESLDLGPFDDQRYFFRPWLGTSVVYHTGKKSTVLGNISFRLMEDEYSTSSLKIRPAGTVLWRLKRSERFSYLLGATYTYNFGVGLPIPILGFQKIFNERSSLRVALPISLVYRNAFKRKEFQYSLFIRPDGNIARFGNNSVFSDREEDNLLLVQRTLKLGVNGTFSFHVFKLTPEFGVLGRRQVSFAEEGGNPFDLKDIYTSDIDPSLYFNLLLQINLSGVKKSTSMIDNMGNEWIGF
jgi:hypothetical protein